MVAVVKEKFKYDDALDAFGVHGIGGILGSILTGVFATDLSISTSMVRVHTATDITLHKKAGVELLFYSCLYFTRILINTLYIGLLTQGTVS